MEINLKHKIALVSGATGQLGRVMAETLASCGDDVVIQYLQNKTKAEELARKIGALGGGSGGAGGYHR